MKIAISGASGFIGKHLSQHLSKHHEIIGLTRSKNPSSIAGISSWRTVDFFSLKESENALWDIDIAFYLVHSMLPKAELAQGNFKDFDAIVADNFGRACRKNQVKRIIYLSGIIPENTNNLSLHLESRLEVEKILSQYEVPLTTLRAGLILGHGGSSFEMMYRLVKNLRIMICPKWTQTISEPIYIDDVIDCLEFVLNHPEKTQQQSFEIGCYQKFSYINLMSILASQMELYLKTYQLKFFTPKLSLWWVKLITGASNDLIIPLVESLKHNMFCKEHKLQEMMNKKPLTYQEAIRKILKIKKETNLPYQLHQSKPTNTKKTVQSVQRFFLPKEKTALEIAEIYIWWLPRFLKTIIKVKLVNPHECSFYIRFFSIKLLGLKIIDQRSTSNRAVFSITNGILARGRYMERFEFREINHQHIIAAIHDFNPKLYWFIYRLTQAKIHLWVMNQFGKYLKNRFSE